MTAFVQQLYALDVAVFRALNGAPLFAALDRATIVASEACMAICLVPLLAVQTWDAGRTWRHALAIGALALAIVGVTDWSANQAKQLARRMRPCEALDDVRALAPCSGSGSLPSSHAANMFALAAFTVACTRRRPALWFGVAAVVAYSRVRMGMHYPLDVLAGALWGIVLGWGTGTVIGRLFVRAPLGPRAARPLSAHGGDALVNTALTHALCPPFCEFASEATTRVSQRQ